MVNLLSSPLQYNPHTDLRTIPSISLLTLNATVIYYQGRISHRFLFNKGATIINSLIRNQKRSTFK